MYCFKCGAKIEVWGYCPKCGFPTQIYFVKPPPKIRLKYSLALALLALGIIGYFIYDLNPDSLELEMTAYYITIPMMITGLILIVATYFRNSLKFWRIDYITALGIALFTVNDYLITAIPDENLPTLIDALITFSFLYVTVGGIIAKKLLQRELKLLNIKIQASKNTFKASLIATIALLAFFIQGSVYITFLVLACSIVTWLIWHFTATRITRIHVYRNLKGENDGSKLILKIDERENVEDVGFTEVLFKASILTLFSFSFLSFLSQFIPILPTEFSEFMNAYTLIMYTSYTVIVLFSPLFAPPSWLLDTLNLRVYDRKKETIKKAQIIETLESFKDIFATLGLIMLAYQLSQSIMEQTLKELGLTTVTTMEQVYMITYTTILMISYMLIPVMTPAILTTALYYKTTYRKHLQKLKNILKPLKIKIEVQLPTPQTYQ